MRRVLRAAGSRLLRWAAWARRWHKIHSLGSPLKANLGSELSVAEGWINVDAGPHALFAQWPAFVHRVLYSLLDVRALYTFPEYHDILKRHTFIHHDVAYGLPFVDNCADFVYSSHLIEHVYPEDVERFVRDIHRVLKPGGVVRIGAPDLARVIALYQQGKKQEAMAQFFPAKGETELGRHKYLYDFDMLKSLLEDAGFEQVRRCEFRQGRTPDIERLDNRPEGTLFVEAVKE